MTACALAACGPGPTPETPQPGEAGGASTSDGGATASAGSGATAAGSKLDENRRAFMDGCEKGGPETKPFCECAWAEMRSAIGDAKMGGQGPDEKDIVDTHPRVMSACKDKMPEPAVKQGFLTGCVAERAEMTPYCECSWAEFRKRFSAADLGDGEVVKTEKFAQARADVTKACGSKISEKVVKEGFLKACARDPKLDKFCGCAWDELRKLAGPAEIEAGLVDRDKVTTTLDKACGKHRPAGMTPAPAGPSGKAPAK